jgi:membrane protein implicated in regulation of membrane protease activity
MSGWLWWLIAAVVFAVGEILTTTLFIGPFSVGALAAVVVALVDGGTLAQLVAFLAGSAAAFSIVRPIVARHRHVPPQIRTGAARLVGSDALVLDPVSRDAGAVRIEGEVWSARSYDEDAVLAAGTRAQVVEIRGAIALVAE